MSTVRTLAQAVDTALGTLESAVIAYLAETQNLNSQFQTAHPGQPDPIYERACEYVEHAAAAKPNLNKCLRLSVASVSTLAVQHPT